MTWKCWWSAALVAAATLSPATSSWAQVVRVATNDPAEKYGWTDSDPTLDQVTTDDPTPAPKRPNIGGGLDSLASPSDLPPPPQGDLDPVPSPYSGEGSYSPGCGAEYAPSCGADYGDMFCPDSCCCSRWAFRAEALFWERSSPSDLPLYVPGAGTGYDAADFNFDYEAGARLTLLRRGIYNSCWDAELAWFGIHGWNETLAGTGPGAYQTTPVINFAGAAPITTNYRSRLDSAELNFRRQRNEYVTWIVGLRWFEEAEDLDTDIDTGTAIHRVDVNNHLFGVQVGADARLWNQGGCWTVDGIAKLGVFHNSADVTTTTAGVGGALPLVTASEDHTVFAAELGVNAVYQFSPRMSGRVGWNLLWLDGMAEAPSQLATTDITTGVATVDFGSTQFYHGLSLGVDYVW